MKDRQKLWVEEPQARAQEPRNKFRGSEKHTVQGTEDKNRKIRLRLSLRRLDGVHFPAWDFNPWLLSYGFLIRPAYSRNYP